jgi:hypothetical protein
VSTVLCKKKKEGILLAYASCGLRFSKRPRWAVGAGGVQCLSCSGFTLVLVCLLGICVGKVCREARL